MEKYKKILRWVLAACCLGYVVWFFVKNTDQLRLLSEIRPVKIVAMGLFFLIGQMLTSYRFKQVLQKSSGRKLPTFKWFKLFILGRFLNLTIPQSGNVYRGVVLKKTYSISYTDYIASFVSFSWMYFCLSLLLAMAVVMITEPSFLIAGYRAVNLLGVLCAIALGGPVLVHFVLPSWKSSVRYIGWLQNKCSEVLRISVQNMADVGYISRFIFLSLLIYFNNMALFYVAFSTFGANVSLSALALFLVVFSLSNRIIITPGNLGLREIAFMIAAKQMNLEMAQAILASAAIRVISTIVLVSMGMVFGGINVLRHRDDNSTD